MNFASFIKCNTLMGVEMQDTVSPPEAQLTVFDKIRGSRLLIKYPKHGHELNNFFENEWLKFVIKNTSLTR